MVEGIKLFLGRMTRAEERPLEKVFMTAQEHSQNQSLFCAIKRSINITNRLSKECLSISQHGFRPLRPVSTSRPDKAPLLSMV